MACKRFDPVDLKDSDGKVAKTLPSPTCMRKIGESACGYCTWTISDKQVFVGNKPENHLNGRSWDELTKRSVILPAEESFAPLKRYIIDSCRAANCDAAISEWRFKLDSLGDLLR